MPFVEAWYAVEAAEGAEAAAAASEAATAAEAASAVEAASAAEAGSAASAGAGAGTAATAGEAATAAQLGQMGLGQLATSEGALAQLGPAMEGATAVGGEGAGGAGIQTAMEGAMQQAPLDAGTQAPAGLEQIAQPTPAAPQTPAGLTPQQEAYMQASQASVNPGITQGIQPLSAPSTTTPAASPYEGLQTNTGWGQQTVEPININPQTSGYGNVINNGGMNAPQPSALEQGWSKFEQFADKHPFMTAGLAYTGAQKLGLFDQKGLQMPNTSYDGPLSKYRLSDNFQAGPNKPNTNQYKPTYPTYAEGGIMESTNFPQADIRHASYAEPWQSPIAQEPFAGATDTNVDRMTGQMTRMASGGIASYSKGNLTETLDFYKRMTEPSTASGASSPHSGGDAGIYYDMDPDTRYQDALTAAQIRQSKLNKRANMQLPSGGVMKRPTPMGSLNLRPPGTQAEQAQSSLDPENAAHGGIMQVGGRSSLGGYAAGGNPRLLKGPGDGMSDNIPATIAGKQPARLADGEFVVPADVVSHLGNGSTDAGAKKLHAMMTEVRKARTGNPKQGKQINPNKFMPK